MRLEGGRSGRLAGLLEAAEQSGALARALAAEMTRTRGSWTSSRSAWSVELPSRQLAATARAVRPPTSAMPQPLPTPTSSTSCAPPAEAPLATAEPSQAAGEPALLAVSHEQRASAAAAPSSSSATSPTSPFIAAPLSTRTLPPADTPPPPAAPAPTSPEDLARQLASFRAEPPAPSSSIVTAAQPAVEEEEEEEEAWLLKTILWPPLPPTPLEAGSDGASRQQGFDTDDRLRVKVVCQNSNGPCSLIALCTSISLFHVDLARPR